MVSSQDKTDPSKVVDPPIASTIGYPPEFPGIRSPEEQLKTLCEYMPGLNPDPTLEYIDGIRIGAAWPMWVEGMFIVPKPKFVLDRFRKKGWCRSLRDGAMRLAPSENIRGLPERADQCRLVRFALEVLGETRPVNDYLKGKIKPSHYQQRPKTVKAYATLNAQQPGHCMVIPGQFGVRWRGFPVDLVVQKLVGNEFCLDGYTNLIITLTHPERYARREPEQLNVDVAGDVCLDATGQFTLSPIIGFSAGDLRFMEARNNKAQASYGAITGIVQPVLR